MDLKQQLKRKAQTDLYWLAKEILGYDLIERVHRPVCDLFVHKDPEKSLAEQDTIKERLLLDPRGHFKTTLDIADCIQWMLNFPNIRINLMTGKEDLAVRMNYELQSHFISNDKLRELFPEFCLESGTRISNFEFWCPARTNTHLREPSISISSMKAVNTGPHYDVIKVDDTVHEGNVGTTDQCQKIIDSFGYTDYIIEPYGYRDRIGTRYDYSDLYGWTLDEIGDKIEACKQPIPFGYCYEDKEIKVLCRQVWICGHDPNVKCLDAPDTHVLLFPERFNEARLFQSLRKHPYQFNCQMLNSPTPTEKPVFTVEAIVSHTIPVENIPRTPKRLFQVWDLGYSKQSYADFSVCATGAFDSTGRLFIYDLDVGRYSPQELIQRIFVNMMLWRPARLGIEESAGVPMLDPALQMYSSKWGIYLPVDYLKVSREKGAKEKRISALHPLLNKGMIYFKSGLNHFNELTKQFTRFPRTKRDDIPDAISLMVQHYRDSVDVYPTERTPEPTPVSISGCEMIGAGLIG